MHRTTPTYGLVTFLAMIALWGTAAAQNTTAQPAAAATAAAPLTCTSLVGERRTCAADTTRGVTLARSLGPGACELGRTWGYDQNGVWVSEGCSGDFSLGPEKEERRFDKYTPGAGFKVVDGERGDLNIRVFTYVNYLDQKGLDDTYTDSFGQTRDVQQRQDLQFNKVVIYFYGWVLSPKFRYTTYVWSTNASQGQSAQVVVAGNLRYQINEHLTVGGGINGLPGVRSTTGNWPFWLSVDARQMADEFFRPSYTTVVWAAGQITRGLEYTVMLGNNLSQLGIDAGQLDNKLDTWSGELAWMPTTGEFGTNSGFGDFDNHDALATRLAAHVTRGNENRQSQPTTDAFDNVQIRISDGNVIFAPNLFAPGVQIDDVLYQMAALDGGVKYRGYSLELELYQRHLSDFRGTNIAALPFTDRDDHGYQLQASMMLLPKTLQAYLGTSKIYGQYGDPSDARVGLNWFPWKNQVVRWNFEVAKYDRSPVGALSLPYSVGATGYVFRTAVMLWL